MHFKTILKYCIVQMCLIIIALIFMHMRSSIYSLEEMSSVISENVMMSSVGNFPRTTSANGSAMVTKLERNIRFKRRILRTPTTLIPFPPGDHNRPLIDETNKLIFCFIPKNSCTQIKAAFCRKFGGIKIYNESRHHNYIHNVCARQIVPRIKSSTTLLKLYNDRTWTKLAIVRDPIERFISAFVDKCRRPTRTAIGASSWCFGLGTNFSLFVKQFVKETEFYSVKNRNRNRMDRHLFDHFMPQFWLSGFDQFHRNYKIVKMGYENRDFGTQLRAELVKYKDWIPIVSTGWGVNSDKSLMAVKEHESPNKRELVEISTMLQNDMDLTDLIYRTFFIDYSRFNLTIPKWISSHCGAKNEKLAICQDASRKPLAQ